MSLHDWITANAPPPLCRVTSGDQRLVVHVQPQPRTLGGRLVQVAVFAGMVFTALLLVWLVGNVAEPLLSIAVAALVVFQLTLLTLPMLALFARHRLRTQRVHRLHLDPFRMTWTDEDGVERDTIGVHQVAAIGFTSDLLGWIVLLGRDGVPCAMRVDDEEQAVWLTRCLQSWREAHARPPNEQDHEDMGRLAALARPVVQ